MSANNQQPERYSTPVMSRETMKRRTKAFALEVIGFVDSLPRTRSADVLGRQLIRSGTSVGANYRAACRGRSPAEFIAKLGIVEEETDEAAYWLELLVEAGIVTEDEAAHILNEADQLLSITVATIRTARKNVR